MSSSWAKGLIFTISTSARRDSV